MKVSKIPASASFSLPQKLSIGLGPIILIFLAITAWSSWYTVPSDSEAILQRFGKLQAEIPPGLHFKIPWGVDTITILPVKRQLKQEFGFYTDGATNPDQYSDNPAEESPMVTGDLNVSVVEWVVQYRIAEPTKYLFAVRDSGATLRDVSESVMREVVGDRTVDEVLTIGRQDIEAGALNRMQQLAARYSMGVSIDQVQLKNVNPPAPVQESFNEVNQAQQEKEKLINEARRDYNRVIPLAEGEKDQRIREAEGYRLKRTNEAEGDVARFNAVFAQYQKSPEVTRRRLYLETMQDVMPAVQNKVMVDESMKNILPLLNLGQKATTTVAKEPQP